MVRITGLFYIWSFFCFYLLRAQTKALSLFQKYELEPGNVVRSVEMSPPTKENKLKQAGSAPNHDYGFLRIEPINRST